MRSTAIICTKGRADLLADSLPALVRAAEAAGDTEVLVVEQGGRSAESLVRAAGARYLHDDGSGVSRARNRAASAATGGVVLFTDDDCHVPERWVVDHLRAFEDQTVAASFGVVDGLPRDLGGDPAASTRLHQLGAAPWEVGHSSNMAVRRDAFLAVGGFDERIGPGSKGVPAGEDADLIARLLSAGCTIQSGTGAPVAHADWRSSNEAASVLAAYERGAGVWIGAALRARRPYALRHLRVRVAMLRERARAHMRAGHTTQAVRLGSGLVRGLARGFLLRPWPKR